MQMDSRTKRIRNYAPIPSDGFSKKIFDDLCCSVISAVRPGARHSPAPHRALRDNYAVVWCFSVLPHIGYREKCVNTNGSAASRASGPFEFIA
ncbi:hypothetical protein EVAR_83435_1 [Eumeta japonica]|uniref:Uncharacterized protein n=1 Tax=Eumeta variegata TaxID=151549 RepID=A0A4C1TYI1_EUMVA|nr:hypothetical protein EVAR_83435_1 [Eumeta japonica]